MMPNLFGGDLLGVEKHPQDALIAVGLVQPHSWDLSTATSGNSSGEP